MCETGRTGKSAYRTTRCLSRNPPGVPVLHVKVCYATCVAVSFSLSSCLDRISQQSHKSAPTDGWSNVLMCIIGAPPIYRPMVCRCAPQADKSAVCAINDSVGKICTDKLTSAGTRQDPAFAAREAAYSSSACEEQEHETRGRSKDCCSFPLHMQVLLIVLGPSFAERRCTDMLTKFTNRVIYRAHRRFIGPRWM